VRRGKAAGGLHLFSWRVGGFDFRADNFLLHEQGEAGGGVLEVSEASGILVHLLLALAASANCVAL